MTRGHIRPGGRTERVRLAVVAAVLGFIQRGVTDFTMSEVAEQSGIARSTLHARWPSRDALIAEALRSHNAAFEVTLQEDWRDHLHHVARAFRDFAARPDEIAINALTANLGASFLAEETNRQWQQISESLAAPLDRARAQGALRPEVDPRLVISTLFTSITARILIAKDVPDDGALERVVDLLIGGCQTGTS